MGLAAEFAAYITLYENLPNLELILPSNGKAIAFPEEPSVRGMARELRALDRSQLDWRSYLWRYFS